VNRVRVLVEGQTEETFVNDILSPHLNQMGVYPHATFFGKNGKGGIISYRKAQRDILSSLKDKDKTLICTTMFDFYGMPKDWPGRKDADSRKAYLGKASTVEDALLKDIAARMDDSWNPARFIPYVQMHEFEALLFSDISVLAADNLRISMQLACILGSFSCPEEINDNYHTCPSRRIKQLIKDYDKRLDGILVAREIGLTTMRQECPHFNEWITKLEDIGNQ